MCFLPPVGGSARRGRRKSRGTAEDGFSHSQVVVAADDECRTSRQSEFQISVVLWVTAVGDAFERCEPYGHSTYRIQNMLATSTWAISSSTCVERAKTSVASARNNARSSTLSALGAAPTTANASKTIKARSCGHGARCCTTRASHRFPRRSDPPAAPRPLAPRSPAPEGLDQSAGY
jgi:hypothetical protein